MAATSSTSRVSLTPTPGFVVKSSVTTPGIYNLSQTTQLEQQQASSSKSLEPLKGTVALPLGIKVFINIAWDNNVPPPPDVSEDVIRRAMMGEDVDVDGNFAEGSYYVPVIVSEPREDKDKAGKNSVVFDCVLSSKLKSRVTKDNDFCLYVIELCLEHIEQKAGIILSRQMGRPNIASKGKLQSRTVLIPNKLLSTGGADRLPKTPLIEEVVGDGAQPLPLVAAPTPRSILKQKSGTTNVSQTKPLVEDVTKSPGGATKKDSVPDKTEEGAFQLPRWTFEKRTDGKIIISMDVPDLTRASHAESFLDIEPRRIIFSAPNLYKLDINLNLPESALGIIDKVAAGSEPRSDVDLDVVKIKGTNAKQALSLKREREFNVDAAEAEWLVPEKRLVISL